METMQENALPEAVVVDTSRSPHARLRPVPLTAVSLTDAFWEPRRRTNREVTIPSQYRHCEDTGRLDNFRRAAGTKDIAAFQGIFFNDSDIYKWLEAASWTLAEGGDPALAAMVETAVEAIESAQQSDGYLDTYFMFEKEKDRFTNLKDMHELYCAGHFLQAAVAHYRATGSDRMLDVARRLADHIGNVFGPKEDSKQEQTDGHEEIEMALVELSRATGDEKYRKLAQFFLDVRGKGTIGGSPYHQDHRPFRELHEVIGHAVRMMYLSTGAADLHLETGETALRDALDRQWDNMTTRRMHVSGGLGARYEGEAFGKDFELPNERAYTETCAAIGSVMWNWRMLQTGGDARYADLMEWTLYNAVLPGLSLDGQAYFYQNPLADDGAHWRQAWFGCACCPPNVARLLASLPGYFYSTSDEGVWAHLYAQGTAALTLPDGRVVTVRQETRYPWDGDVALHVAGEGEFGLFVRIPAWCEEGATLEVDGEPYAATLAPGSYTEVRREWRPGSVVRLHLPMPVRRIECHPYVAENRGRVALARGPILFCLEGIDHPEIDLRDLVLPAGPELSAAFRPDLLNGVVTLGGNAQVAAPADPWSGRLYRAARGQAATQAARPVPLTAVPYYAWANREPGRLQVWLRAT